MANQGLRLASRVHYPAAILINRRYAFDQASVLDISLGYNNSF